MASWSRRDASAFVTLSPAQSIGGRCRGRTWRKCTGPISRSKEKHSYPGSRIKRPAAASARHDRYRNGSPYESIGKISAPRSQQCCHFQMNDLLKDHRCVILLVATPVAHLRPCTDTCHNKRERTGIRRTVVEPVNKQTIQTGAATPKHALVTC